MRPISIGRGAIRQWILRLWSVGAKAQIQFLFPAYLFSDEKGPQGEMASRSLFHAFSRQANDAIRMPSLAMENGSGSCGKLLLVHIWMRLSINLVSRLGEDELAIGQRICVATRASVSRRQANRS